MNFLTGIRNDAATVKWRLLSKNIYQSYSEKLLYKIQSESSSEETMR